MSKTVIEGFWEAMATNDFGHASTWLSADFEYFMPQTGEYLRGPQTFAALNTAYPAQGRWHFDVRTIVAEGDQVVSDVAITDGVIRARAITFHTVENDLIRRQIEYWPDDYPPPEWRARFVTVAKDFPF